MTLEELDSSLPNGFHDSLLLGLKYDFEASRVELILDIDFSDTSKNAKKVKNRRDILVLESIHYFLLEKPEKMNSMGQPQLIDVGFSYDKVNLPSGAAFDSKTSAWIFLNRWNSFIHLRCARTTLTYVVK